MTFLKAQILTEIIPNYDFEKIVRIHLLTEILFESLWIWFSVNYNRFELAFLNTQILLQIISNWFQILY